MTASGTRLADVHAAADRIGDLVLRTPLLAYDGLWLKAEHLQTGGSFKARGAANALLGTGARAVVAGSSGNHGIALATLGRDLGVPVTIVMAEGASAHKAGRIRALGAEVVSVPGGVVARDAHAVALAAATGALAVPSSDHELVLAGQGTVGLEILADLPEVATIFVPTGGGGLLAGICAAAEELGHPVRVVGVEPAGADRYARSFAAGRPVELPPSRTVADGLRGQRPGAHTLPVIRRRVDALVTVTDAEITQAVADLAARGVHAEPSGAVAIAGALRHPHPGPAVAIVSGGNTTKE